MSRSTSTDRIDVRKTAKLYIGGAFPRSESGHSYEVTDSKGRFVANASLASRKDARDAVVAARSAFHGWSGRTAYNRGQIVYRVAEMLEDRRAQFVAAVSQAEGLTAARADKVVDASVDRLVWYAGWADKITQVVGNANPVAGPVLQPLDSRADRRGRGARAAGLLTARAGQRDRAGDRHRQHGGRRDLARAAATRGRTRRGAGNLRRARRSRQHPDRLGGDRSRPGWPRTSTSTRST